ncbi:hypothetical protein LX15_004226 [Streptoalloteichus tenebrarius]|uniref:SH3 domain-containing protein n=1 Tax=Streptoalloteichus tenebrarius (strain ATCC 17920 / DSM 40477 / JCM 4838 / CBS 697.72 / NBRC 16177 / NCIMB 11028 / NRRL B-12390 / A12253. 1 / ISP 5477) TaxID=1933 RepID=A0ABT1HYA4_STRSD|nr:SH3 domain-containing protein [Streptoalloteichus tenebrarius]MCP2260508.1 hypothetical protein [Streptoalloteichus tenebrarius]BFF02694.1 hypothetical protein GCM10020241_43690 [Streptoalloteichus tenebrarius]
MALPVRPLVIGGVLVAVGVAVLAGGGDKRDGVSPVSDRARCEFRVSADLLNVRAGPATDQRVVERLRGNALVSAQPSVENGFRKLGDNRWAAAEFLTPAPGNSCQ